MFDFKQLNSDLENKSIEDKKQILNEIKKYICDKKKEFIHKYDYELAAEYRDYERKIIDLEDSLYKNN